MADKEQFIKALKILMIVAGFWKKPLSKSGILNKMYQLYFIFAKLVMFVLCVELLLGLIKLIKNQGDIQLIIAAISVLITGYVVIIKAYICIERRLIETLDEIEKFEEDIWKINNEQIRIMYISKTQFSNNVCIGLAIAQLVATIALFISGFLGDRKQIAYNIANNVRIDSHYLYQIWFPAFKLDHLVLVYTLNMIFCLFASLTNIVAHSIIITLMIFATVQLQVLNIKLRCFIENKNDNLGNKTIELKQYVKEHQNLISYVKHLNSKIQIIILMHFVLNSFEISSCVVGLMKNNTAAENIFLLTYVNLVSYQLFMTSWNANDILEESIAIADAVYTSNWHLLDKEGKAICNIMIQRAQRPLTLTIGPFGPMTNKTSLLVLKAAYSYISIMNRSN